MEDGKKISADELAILKQLVTDVQGAPFPCEVNNELYEIWYEHAQRVAIQCLEYLDVNFPELKEDDVLEF